MAARGWASKQAQEQQSGFGSLPFPREAILHPRGPAEAIAAVLNACGRIRDHGSRRPGTHMVGSMAPVTRASLRPREAMIFLRSPVFRGKTKFTVTFWVKEKVQS